MTVHLRRQTTSVELQLLAVPKHERARGVGSRVLERVCRWADSSGVQLSLTPDGAFGMDVRRLADWYGRYGFRRSGSGRVMRREPVEWLRAVA